MNNELLDKVREQYKESANKHYALMSKYFEPNYEEEFTDTINRTYEEGYTDALRYVIDLLLGEDK